MYNPTGLSQQIFKDRYTHTEDETWVQASRRVAKHVAKAEKPEYMKTVEEAFFYTISNNHFMPGGRIWYGAGRDRAQLLNCFVIPTHDSREGWGDTVKDVIVISGMGGGVGINCSPIRPRGSKIKGTGGVATGSVSLMQMINNVGDVIVGGGGRRMALMLDLNINHPDLLEFMDKKLDNKELNNANVSVVMNIDPKEFVELVKTDGYIQLEFEGSTDYDKISARKIWERVVSNAWNSGEPGVLNGFLANQESNIWYHKPLVSTNPCGEIWLEEYGCCDLGALVLPRFVENGLFDFGLFRSSIKIAVRFLDNVLTVNEYPTEKIRENCLNLRRIGLGVMGLHDMLIKMGIKYSSKEAIEFVDILMDTLKTTAYQASIDLAKEKGAFPAYEDKFIHSGFVQRAISPSLQEAIAMHGIRNCALLTIAPTGTTGMVSNVSTGIEPIFAPAYWRRFYRPSSSGDRVLDKELVIDKHWDEVVNEGQSLDILEGAYDVSPRSHFEMQAICQKHIDNATSKTINLPEDFPVDSLSDLWLEFLPELKGTTFYRAGSRGEEPLEAIPLAEAKILMALKTIHKESSITEENSMDCVGDQCGIPEDLKPHIEIQQVPQIQFV